MPVSDSSEFTKFVKARANIGGYTTTPTPRKSRSYVFPSLLGFLRAEVLESQVAATAGPRPTPAPSAAGGSALFVSAGGNPRTAAWLSVAQPASELQFSGGQDFTIECFIYLNAVGAFSHIFSTLAGGSGGVGLIISSSDVTFYGGGGSSSVLTTNALNTWIHYAVVRESGTISIYKNGTSIPFALPVTIDLSGYTDPLIIGQSAGTKLPANEFTGYITNFRWVVGTAVYTANFAVPTTPLTAIANTSLLLSMNTSGTLLTDSSTQNLTVTNVGTTWNALKPF